MGKEDSEDKLFNEKPLNSLFKDGERLAKISGICLFLINALYTVGYFIFHDKTSPFKNLREVDWVKVNAVSIFLAVFLYIVLSRTFKKYSQTITFVVSCLMVPFYMGSTQKLINSPREVKRLSSCDLLKVISKNLNEDLFDLNMEKPGVTPTESVIDIKGIPDFQLKKNELVAFLYGLAKVESGGDTNSIYVFRKEDLHSTMDKVLKTHTTYGLFQVNMSMCKEVEGIIEDEDLYDPDLNTKCAMNILAKKLDSKVSLFSENAAYWETLTTNNTLYRVPEILQYREEAIKGLIDCKIN